MICGPASVTTGGLVVHVAGRGNGGPDTRLDRPHNLDHALAIREQRYRHPEPVCDGFLGGKPEAVPTRGRHVAFRGRSYKQETYENIARLILGRASRVADVLLDEVLAARAGAEPATVDEVTLARVASERDRATRKLSADRDTATWAATMQRLDIEEAAARVAIGGARLTADEVRDYVRDLPRLWQDADPAGRKSLAANLFASFEAEGLRRIRWTWTPGAVTVGLGSLVPGEIIPTADEWVLVGARGIAPPPTTFRSPCVSLSLRRPSSWSGAHDGPGLRTRDGA